LEDPGPGKNNKKRKEKRREEEQAVTTVVSVIKSTESDYISSIR
jgi:hypothetical protein